MYSEKLKRLISAPDNPVKTGDFTTANEKLGIRLPDDYFEFLSVYGTGMFGNSLEVYSPLAENEYINLFAQIETLRDSYQAMKKIWNSMNMDNVFPVNAGYPFDFYPEKGGLIPWGCIDGCGIYFYWITGDPDREIAAYCDDDYRVFKMSMTEFIYNLMTAEIDFAGLSDITKEDLYFTPYQAI